MAFDRRSFFKSLLTVSSGAALAKKLPESFEPFTVKEPNEIPVDGPFPLAENFIAPARFPYKPLELMRDRRLWCYYDTAEVEAGRSVPQSFWMFSAGRGQVDYSGNLKDEFSTNFEGNAYFQKPFSMLVQRVGIVFDPDASGNADLIKDGLRLEFWFMQRRFVEAVLLPNQDGYCFVDCNAYVPSNAYFKFAVVPKYQPQLQVNPNFPEGPRIRLGSGPIRFVTTMSGFVDFPVA